MRKKWLPLTLFLALFSFPPGGPVVSSSAPFDLVSPSHYDQPLSVVTYNIRGCRTDTGAADPERIASALRTLDADVIALQEVDVRLPRSGFVDQVAAIAAQLRMNFAYGPSIDFAIGSYGNAVLSKFPIRHAEIHRLPAEWEPRSLLDVSIDWNGYPLHVLVTHLGVKKSEHREQVESLYDYLQEKSYDSTVLLGDLNMLPSDPLLRQLRGPLLDPQYERKLVLRTLKHDGPPKEIDRILYSRDFGFLAASAPAIGPSDHFPVKMELKRSGLSTVKKAIPPG